VDSIDPMNVEKYELERKCGICGTKHVIAIPKSVTASELKRTGKKRVMVEIPVTCPGCGFEGQIRVQAGDLPVRGQG